MRNLKAPLAAAAVAALVLAGCGTTSERTSDEPQAGSLQGVQGADGKYVIGMSQANVAEPYRQRMDDDIKAAAKEVPQFEVKFADAAQDNAKQVADVENYLTQQIDLLIISPNEAKPLTAVVKKAFDKGIPVIVLDRKVEGDAYTGFIGGDNVADRHRGRQVRRREAAAERRQRGRDQGPRPARRRRPSATRASRTGSRRNPKIKVIATASGDWLREKGQAQMDALLKANPKIDVVYAHNDPMAEGAYLAAKAVGREKEMKFIGIDALPIPSGGIKAVEQGRLSRHLHLPDQRQGSHRRGQEDPGRLRHDREDPDPADPPDRQGERRPDLRRGEPHRLIPSRGGSCLVRSGGRPAWWWSAGRVLSVILASSNRAATVPIS